MTAPRFDVIDVRAALTAQAVLEHYGWRFRRCGRELRGPACPGRADHSRADGFSVNIVTGKWQCFPCGTSGDLLAFIATVERLDIAADFPAVIELAAAIAGVGLLRSIPPQRPQAETCL